MFQMIVHRTYGGCQILLQLSTKKFPIYTEIPKTEIDFYEIKAHTFCDLAFIVMRFFILSGAPF